jgi:serine phosphatase RsbU (regulator of sigma subunit)/integral membrane sensor domain MASE1/anti-sigma regulatory factor (Ser/Thr protein kinase)
MTGREGTPKISGVAPLHLVPTSVRRVGLLGLVGATYYLGARLGLSLSVVEQNVTPLWPPTGIALAAFLLLGRSMWPGVALAAFAVNLPISEGLVSAAVTAAGNTVAPLVAATLLGRVGFRRQLDRQRDALAIVFVGALASMLISATTGTAALVASGAIPSDQFPSAWAVWWTGDAMGVLAFAPFLLSLPLFWELRPWLLLRWVEAITILVAVAAVTAWAAHSDLHVLFLTLPVLGWAAWRLQLRGAAPAALIAALVASWSATRGMGPFERGSLFEQMLTLQAFNACVALTSFFLAALVSERKRAAHALAAAAAELEERVALRTAELSAANTRLLLEIQERSEAQEQLSHEEARARREHHIAETLQRSLLPDRLPEIPGVALAARYVPATADVQVGGDWYDVVPLPGGLIGLAIGDVAGHGLPAAATMGQLRMALRAYALQDPSPASVMRGVHHLVSQLPMPEMVTLMYLVYDPATRELRFTNAGHPPTLVIAHGEYTYLQDGLAPPVGVTADATYAEVCHELPEGATLLLYTDGLVERRGESIQEGLDRLGQEAVTNATSDLDELCDHLLSALVGQDQVADDIAVVGMRAVSLSTEPLDLRLRAEPRNLVQMRVALRRWLREWEVATIDQNDILASCGEACANVVQHAYGAARGDMLIHAALVHGAVELSVRDHGAWRPPADRGGGWGLQLIRGLMDSVDVNRDSGGTEVRMRRRVRIGVAM